MSEICFQTCSKFSHPSSDVIIEIPAILQFDAPFSFCEKIAQRAPLADAPFSELLNNRGNVAISKSQLQQHCDLHSAFSAICRRGAAKFVICTLRFQKAELLRFRGESEDQIKVLQELFRSHVFCLVIPAGKSGKAFRAYAVGSSGQWSSARNNKI